MSEHIQSLEERDRTHRVKIKYSETSPRCCYIKKTYWCTTQIIKFTL